MIDYSRIVPATAFALARYVEFRREPGSFLLAVVENDLKGAIACGDENSLASLPSIVAWFYNHTLPTCYGSPERVEAWLNGRGARYYRADESLALLGIELVDGELRSLGEETCGIDGTPLEDGPFAEGS